MINSYNKYGDILGKLHSEDIHDTIEKFAELRSSYIALSKLKTILTNYNDYFFHIDSLYQELEKKRNDYWLPIYKKVKMPYLLGYNCFPDFNGDLYLAINMKDYIDIPSNYLKGARKMSNIKDSKPSDGTIIGKLTENELKDAINLEIKVNAINSISIECSSLEELDKLLYRLEDIEKSKFEVWIPIFKRLKASWEWDLRTDFATGNVYVINYDVEDEE